MITPQVGRAPLQSGRMCLPCNAALAAEGRFLLSSHRLFSSDTKRLAIVGFQGLRNLWTFSAVRLADAIKYTFPARRRTSRDKIVTVSYFLAGFLFLPRTLGHFASGFRLCR